MTTWDSLRDLAASPRCNTAFAARVRRVLLGSDPLPPQMSVEAALRYINDQAAADAAEREGR